MTRTKTFKNSYLETGNWKKVRRKCRAWANAYKTWYSSHAAWWFIVACRKWTEPVKEMTEHNGYRDRILKLKGMIWFGHTVYEIFSSCSMSTTWADSQDLRQVLDTVTCISVHHYVPFCRALTWFKNSRP